MGLLVAKNKSAEYGGLVPDYYISTTGSNSNDGLTPATAWALDGLNEAAKQSLYGGKVVGAVDGTYGYYDIFGEPLEGTYSSSPIVELEGGSAGTPTIFVSQTPRGAILDGQRTTVRANHPTKDWGQALLGCMDTPAGDYTTIDGFKFVGGNYRYITNYRDKGANFLTIRNCHFTDQHYDYSNSSALNAGAIYTENRNDILISNCRFEEGEAEADSGRYSYIQAYGGINQSSENVIIEYCTIIMDVESGNGIYWKADAGQENLTGTVRYCYIDTNTANPTGTSGACIHVNMSEDDVTDPLVIHNNVCVVAADNGFQVIRHNSLGGHVGTWEVRHNTWAGDWGTAGSMYEMWRTAPATFDFYENIIAPTTGGQGTYGDFSIGDYTELDNVDYNMYPSPAKWTEGASPANSHTTIADWRTASSVDANSTQDDPEFVATGTEADYYKLDTGSPALTAAEDGGEIGAWRGASRIGCDFT